jgi:hypothetical protein
VRRRLIGVSQAAGGRAGVDVRALERDRAGRVTFTSRGRHRYDRRASVPADGPAVGAGRRAGAGRRRRRRQLQTGTAVTAYAQDADGVALGTATGTVRARVVVAADGSGSRAAAHVGVVCEQVDLGMEAELPTPAGSDWSGRVLLDWGPVPGSYGWVFPKGDRLTVGVIGAREHGGAVRDWFGAFVAAQGLDLADGENVGGHLTRVRAPSSPVRPGPGAGGR